MPHTHAQENPQARQPQQEAQRVGMALVRREPAGMAEGHAVADHMCGDAGAEA